MSDTSKINVENSPFVLLDDGVMGKGAQVVLATLS